MGRRLGATSALVLFGLGLGLSGAPAAETYPFVGNWVRSDRSCAASPTRERVYTAKEVTSSRSRCSIRRVASGSGAFQLFEHCERPGEKPASVSEIIRMTGPDSMVLTRQTARLKLSRSLRFTRCPGTPLQPAATKPVR